MAKNVLGGELEPCSVDPLTGFYRDGCCRTGADDAGVHTVCVRVTDAFLEFSASVGNDLSTPRPGFPGLRSSDRWCLCAPRWQEALDAGMAPEVVLESTHAATLEWVSLEDLQRHAVRRGQDRPSQDRPGQDRPGQDWPSQDRPGQDRPGGAGS